MEFRPPDIFRHLFIVSGPSGAGKASVMERILRETNLQKVVTYATRPMRSTERNGIDYWFVSPSELEGLSRDGKIAESARAYSDFSYASPVLRFDPSGPDGLIELDPDGRATFASTNPDHFTSVFLLPPSLRELRRRIESRHKETNLDRRLSAAVAQIRRCGEYDFIIVNDHLESACEIAVAIVRAHQQRLARESLLRLSARLVQEPD